MPYDPVKDPWRGVAVSPNGLGRAGALIAPDDVNDLARYARIRVFAPATLSTAQIKILPANALDAAPVTLPLPVGQVSVLEFLVRRVFASDTTAGVIIHRID